MFYNLVTSLKSREDLLLQFFHTKSTEKRNKRA